MVIVQFSLAADGAWNKGWQAKKCKFVHCEHNKKGKQAKWTLMVYMSGDNNLEDYVTKDIQEELAVLGSNKDVQVVVLADRLSGDNETVENWSTGLIFNVTKDLIPTSDNAVADLGEINMGDPQTLTDFICWTRHNYPARHYALVFWGHGAGWRPGWNMYDTTSDYDALNPDEMVQVFKTAGSVDVVAFDACESQWLELAVQLKDYTKVMAASQEWVDWDGIDYSYVISRLRQNPFMPPRQLGIEIADSFTLYNSERTASAVCSGPPLNRLIKEVDELGKALIDGMQSFHAQLVTARELTQHYSYGYGELWDTNIDLYDAVEKIKQNVDDPYIKRKCQAVMDSVKAVVLYEWHNTEIADYTESGDYVNVHGISIYWPESQDELDIDFDYYKDNLLFSDITHWDEFCEAFVKYNE